MEKTIITYEMYDHMLDKLVEQIEFSNLYTKVKYVYGPPRGGLPMAVHLAHHLDLTLLDRFDFKNLPRREWKKVLLVDDVADTGKTLHEIRNTFGVFFSVATLHYKPRSIVKPNFYVEETTDWLIYPWEKLDEIPNREGYDDL